MTMPAANATPGLIELASLHASMADPVLDSLNFLNEVMDRYPHAISFAPGAPYGGFLEQIDVQSCLDRYCDYLRREKNLPDAAILRKLFQYGPSQGLINDLIAAALSRDFDIHAGAEAIVVTVGCQEAMLLALRALCATRQDVLAVVQPCFVGIVGAARVLDVEVQAVDEAQDEIDFDQLACICREARESGKRVRALYVAPDCSNPSGSMLSRAARIRLLEMAEDEDFIVLEDNAYAFTVPAGAEQPCLKALDTAGRVIYLGTFAKVGMPGARVGFLVADQRMRDARGTSCLLAQGLATIKSMVTVNTSPICQAIIGGMLLEHGRSLAALGRQKAEFYRRNLALLLEALDRYIGPQGGDARVTWNIPRGGFFVRMRLPVAVDETLLELAADRYGVLWTPMAFFYLNRQRCDELRLSCSYLSEAQIDEGVRRLAAFLRDPRIMQGRLA